MCTARLRYKNKDIKSKFFVLPRNSPALPGILDIELLNLLRITCDVMGGPHESRKLDSNTVEVSNNPS